MGNDELISHIYLFFIVAIPYMFFIMANLNKKCRSIKSKYSKYRDSEVTDEDLSKMMEAKKIEAEKIQSETKKTEDDLIITNIKLNNLQNNVDTLNGEVHKNTQDINAITSQISKEKNEYDRRIKINEERLENKKIIMDFGEDNLIKSLIIVLNSSLIKNNIENLTRRKRFLSRENTSLKNSVREYEKKYNRGSTFTPIDYKPIRGNGKDRFILTTYSFRLEQNHSSRYNISKLVPYIKRSIKPYDGLTTVEFLEKASTLEKNYEINYEYNKRVYIKEESNKAYLEHTLFGDIGTIPKDIFTRMKRFLTHDFLITWSLEGGKYRFIDSHLYTEKEFINTSSSSYEIHVTIDFYI